LHKLVKYSPPLKHTLITRGCEKKLENKEKAQLDAQHQKELDSLKEDVARLTSLLEQALRSKSGEETSSQPTFIAQLPPTFTAPFNPPNLGACITSLEPQYAVHFPAQLVYPIRIPELTLEESHKDKMVEDRGLEKWVALEQRMMAVEENNLYDGS
jgi:uncharacterized protein YecE (DUF72 family)